MISLIPTHWVIMQYNKQCKKQLIYQIEKSESASEYVNNRLTLEQILATKDGFDVLANHLVNEFSIENLFFVFELVQIKKELIDHGLIGEEAVGAMIQIDLQRIANFRRKDSHIYNKAEMKKNLRYVVQQYIEENGEFCINISSELRRTTLTAWDDLCRIDDEGTASASAHAESAHVQIDVDVGSGDGNEHEHVTEVEVDCVVDPDDGVCMDIVYHTGNNEYEQNVKVIKEYLDVFELSMIEIIALIRNDSLNRFYDTKSYLALRNVK